MAVAAVEASTIYSLSNTPEVQGDLARLNGHAQEVVQTLPDLSVPLKLCVWREDYPPILMRYNFQPFGVKTDDTLLLPLMEMTPDSVRNMLDNPSFALLSQCMNGVGLGEELEGKIILQTPGMVAQRDRTFAPFRKKLGNELGLALGEEVYHTWRRFAGLKQESLQIGRSDIAALADRPLSQYKAGYWPVGCWNYNLVVATLKGKPNQST